MLSIGVVCVTLVFCHRATGDEFGIGVPSREVCEDLHPPNATLVPNNGSFLFIQSWINKNKALVFISAESSDTINGLLLQGRINDTISGRFQPGESELVLNCPPGKNNTLTAIYENARHSVAGIWVTPGPDFDNYTDVTFRAAVLITNRTFCLLEGVLDHKERHPFLLLKINKRASFTDIGQQAPALSSLMLRKRNHPVTLILPR